MAAIAGVLRLDGMPEALRDVRTVMSRMSHRAPDGVGDFGVDGFALAHGALHTLPEAVHERQPILLGERWALAVDGRIDRRDDLFRALGIDSHAAGSMCDADLFAQAWLRWKESFWKHIVGDFALAVWDRQESRLILMRDRIGVRPLYYARSAKLLAFASEPEPLLGLDGVSRICNNDALAYVLTPNFQPRDRGATFYRDVRRVEPGEVLSASADGDMRLARYWSMQPGPELRLRDPREYVEAFRQVFAEATHCRLRSLHRPALMLSGGIDSASLLAASRLPGAAGKAGELLPISIVGDPDEGCEETENILHLHGAGAGIRLPAAELPHDPLFGDLCEAVWGRAHPIDNSILYARLVCLAARRAGSNVMLDGADGDVVMLNDRNHAGRLALAGHPLQALREARLASCVNTYLRGMPPWRILAHGLAANLQPGWLSTWRYRRHDRQRGDAGLGSWIDRGFARRLRLRERSLDMAIEDRRRPGRGSRAERLIGSWWSPGFTRTMEGTDRTYADAGVEARHPWCDQRVVEFFLNLPEEYVMRDGWTKWIARAAYADELGETVAWYSGKYHLGPLATLQVIRGTRGQLLALLQQARTAMRGVLDEEALARLCDAWSLPGGGNETDIGDALVLATLVAWERRFGLEIA